MIYPRTEGTAELMAVYGCNRDRDKILSALGYTYQQAKDKFEAWVGFCEFYGWTQAEVLGMYEVECAWNDWVWGTDTYMGQAPVYSRNGLPVCQSRGTPIAPHGTFRLKYGLLTAIGKYLGKHANCYGVPAWDAQTPNPGSTPGTQLVIDHAGWMNARTNSIRMALRPTALGANWNTQGGISYTEGVHIEGFRIECGGQAVGDTAVTVGVGAQDPGENSKFVQIYVNGAKDASYRMYGGTPAHFDTCSSFNCGGAGFDLQGTTGLHNTVMTMPSGDDNKGGLIRIGAAQGGVAGATLTVNGYKNESRNTAQKILTANGSFNVILMGITADYEPGVPLDGLIEIDGRNPAGGQDWQLEVHGLKHSTNVGAVVIDKGNNVKWKGNTPWKPVTFILNDEGMKFASRNLTSEPIGTTPPPTPIVCTGWTTGAWSAWGPCTGGVETRTRTVTATPAGCTGTPPNKPTESETRACTVPPPTGALFTGGPYAMNTPGFIVNVPSVTCTKVKLTSLVANSPLGFGRVVGTGPNLPSLAVDSTGAFKWGAGASWVTIAAPKVVAGTAWSGTITLPVAATVKHLWNTDPGNAGALQGTCGKVELLS